MRYSLDLVLNPGLPTIISEYYGAHTFFDAKEAALDKLDEWEEESLCQIQEQCPAENLERRRRAIVAIYKDHQKTVRNWCRQDVDGKEQDAIAGPLSAVIQVLPRNRRQAVFAEVMQGVCNLDSADLQRLSKLISKISHADSDADPDASGNI